MKLFSRDIVIQKCLERHGSKYSYDRLVYNGALEKIEIVCHKHGPFWQEAGKHWSGYGCDKCLNDNLRCSTEGFVKKAVKLHGPIYDYSKVVYLGAFKKVEIVCQYHGSFWQIPTNHIKKSSPRGCSKCRGGIKLSHDDFLSLVSKNTKFNSHISGQYANWLTPIEITCDKHGIGHVLPTTILNGYGCGYCNNKPKRFDEKWFVEKAVRIHGSRYDYSNLDYDKEFVYITCSSHGRFRQKAYSHLKGYGCKFCGRGNVSKVETDWLNVLKVPKKCRNRSVRIMSKLYYPDGLNKKDKIIYEFLGDYWHGNPKVFDSEKTNAIRGLTFGDLYRLTMERIKAFRSAGYTVLYVWEKDFKSGIIFSI